MQIVHRGDWKWYLMARRCFCWLFIWPTCFLRHVLSPSAENWFELISCRSWKHMHMSSRVPPVQQKQKFWRWVPCLLLLGTKTSLHRAHFSHKAIQASISNCNDFVQRWLAWVSVKCAGLATAELVYSRFIDRGDSGQVRNTQELHWHYTLTHSCKCCGTCHKCLDGRQRQDGNATGNLRRKLHRKQVFVFLCSSLISNQQIITFVIPLLVVIGWA